MFKNNFVKNFPAAGLSLRLSLRFFQINAHSAMLNFLKCVQNITYKLQF